jgi:tetratricopeptide (TPR) repeat protein
MNEMNTPEVVYTKILNKDIKIEKGIISLIGLLQEYDNDDFLYEIKEVIDRLAKKFIEIYDLIINIYESEKKPIIRLAIVKLLIITFPKKCIKFTQEKIKQESSAIFLTFLYSFLDSQMTETSKKLKRDLVEKYATIYNLDLKECPFLIDLEKTQINKIKQLDIPVGYFKKFATDDINVLENSSHFNYVVKNRHIQALDLSRWEFIEIPESICLLLELTYLNLSDLRLKLLPESLGNLLKFDYINLSGNEINKIPEWLLEIARTRISKPYLNEGVISSEVLSLAIIEIFIGKKLQKVEQTKNVIHWDTALHYKINNNGNILGIYLKNENLKLNLFPEQICELKFLEELEIPDSSIQTLPKCIGNLKSLKYLNLYNNRIKIIPETIENLINLEYLDLDDNDMSESSLLGLSWYKIGQQYLEVGEFNTAIIELKDTLKIYTKNKYGWYHLGIAHKELGDDKEAEKAFKTFLEIDNTNSLVWSELSEIYHLNKEYNKAIEAIKHAIDMEPELAILYSNLAFNYKKIGKYDDAIKAYSRSLEIFPDNIYVWRDLASIYRDKGEIIKAIDADEHALELEHKSNINLD